MSRDDWVGTGLFVGALVLAAIGQFTFAQRREYLWDGVLLWALAILLLSLALVRVRRAESGRSVRGRPHGARWLSLPNEHPVRTLMGLGGLWISVAVGFLAIRRAPDAGYAHLLVLWTIGVVSFLGAFIPARLTSPTLWRSLVTDGEAKRWIIRHRLELAALLLLVVVSLVVRAYDLEHIPANLSGDEGTQGVEALRITEPPLGNPFSTGWFSVPTMSFLAYGLSMGVFGQTVAGLRTASALIGAATVLSTFLLARELWGRRVAWFSAAALSFSHYHIHFSRLGSNQIADPLLVTLALWFLVRGLRQRRAILFALAGVTIGLGWYAYFGARLVGVIAGGYLVLQVAFRHRFLSRYSNLLIVLAAGAVVVLAPLLFHYAARPHTLGARPRQVSIFASGWLEREQEITGRGAFSLLVEQFWKSISAFNYTLDPTYWYRASIPLLDVVSGLFFILGMIWVVGHLRRPANSLVLIWFWLALTTGWVITENPPSSQRMILAAPALALLVGQGLDWAVEAGHRIVGGRDVLWRGAGAIVLTAAAVLNLGYYFLVYTPTRVYGNPTAEMATHLARYLADQDDDYVVYLHGLPFVQWDLGTLRFMAPEVTGVDVPPADGGEQPQPDLSRGARFVFYGPRSEELENVRARYPGGSAEYVRSRAHGGLLYALYEVRQE